MGSLLRRASELGHKAPALSGLRSDGLWPFGQFDGDAVFWQGLPVGYVIRQKSKGRSCAA